MSSNTNTLFWVITGAVVVLGVFLLVNNIVEKNVDIAKKSSSEENKTENKVVSSNLNVEGNLTIGATKDINIKASNLNSNQDITLKSGNDINILNDYDTVSKENIRKDITVSAGANLLLSSLIAK